MNFRSCVAFLVMVPAFLSAGTFKNLPEWAQSVYQASRLATKPNDTDQWILLDRTEFAYTGDGEIAIHRYRLIEVLTNRGTDAGIFATTGLGGGASKVKKLKGWNLKPNGDLVKLDSENVVAIEKAGSGEGVSNRRMTGAILESVVQGSLIAFESLQVETDPGGPSQIAYVMEPYPIFRWEIHAATKAGWFKSFKQVSYKMDFRNFSPWIPSPVVVPNVSISADNIPAIPTSESATPYAWDILPRVGLVFMDPDLKDQPSFVSWDRLASWTESIFQQKAAPLALPFQPAPSGPESLSSIHQWMKEQLTYKQVYLSPERGLVPLEADQVLRRRYGDCKDLASCFIAAVRAAGIEAFPVLARIEDGRIGPEESVNPACFNHVIAAVRLKQTLHLDAEVETTAGRFLLVDPTARLTPFGKLPTAHSRGRLMICAQSKGVWIDVADSALDHPRLEATLTGVGERTGQVHGTLTLKEWGNSRGLRLAALGMTPLEYRQFVFSKILALPANAHIQVIRHSNPMDLANPFEVEIEIDDPKGFEVHESEWKLSTMGIFRMIPPIIQKAGKPRRFPIETFGHETMAIRAYITVPAQLTPFLPRRVGGTAFHDFLWEAQAQPAEGGKTNLSLHFKNSHKPARFSFENKEAGLIEWMKDRRMMQDVIADALAFQSKP